MAQDDQVAVPYTLEGTHQGPFAGLPGTGKRVTLSGIAIFRLAGGRIAEGWGCADFLDFLRNVREVRFGPQLASVDPPSVTDTSIRVVAPALRPNTGGGGGPGSRVPNTGVVDVVVFDQNKLHSPLVPADPYSYGPAITSVSPNIGPMQGGIPITITGTNLSDVTSVSFGHATVGVKRSDLTDTSARVELPAFVAPLGDAPPGSKVVDAIVHTSSRLQSPRSPEDLFTYESPPLVQSINPTRGPAAGGTIVTILGSGFTGATQVHFGANVVNAPASHTDTQMVLAAPPGSGTVDVTVTTLGGTSPLRASDQFTYIGAPPSVSSVLPVSGPLAGGSGVTITGSGFTGATDVRFGDTAAGQFSIVSDTQVSVTAPPGVSAGVVDVQVTGPAGTSPVTPQDRYTYLPLPIVTAVTPSAGPTSGGTQVTISGSGFATASAVTFGSLQATSFNVVSDTQVTLATPVAASAGAVDVTVTTAGGTSARSAADVFTYHMPTAHGHAYVANTGSDSVSVIDTVLNQVVRTLLLPGARPGAVVLDSTGRRLYVAGVADNTIYALDATTGTILNNFNLPASGGACGPISLALNNSDSRLYVEGSTCSTATVLDTSNPSAITLVANVPGVAEGGMVAIFDGAHQAYFADRDNTTGGGVRIMDATCNTITGNFSTSGRQAFGLFAKDGVSDWLWIAGLQNNSASGVVKNGLQWTAVSPTAPGGFDFSTRIGTDLRGVAASGNVDTGATAAVADAGSNQVWLVQVLQDTSTQKPVSVGQGPIATAVSLDQKLAYVSNQTDGTVSVVDTGTAALVTTIPRWLQPIERGAQRQLNMPIK